MANKISSSNPNFQPKTYLIAIDYEEHSSGEFRPRGLKKIDITKILEDNNVFFGAQDIRAVVDEAEGAIPETRFVIRSDEYASVENNISIILEGAIVNPRQLDAVTSMVRKAFHDEVDYLWGRCRVD